MMMPREINFERLKNPKSQFYDTANGDHEDSHLGDFIEDSTIINRYSGNAVVSCLKGDARSACCLNGSWSLKY